MIFTTRNKMENDKKDALQALLARAQANVAAKKDAIKAGARPATLDAEEKREFEFQQDYNLTGYLARYWVEECMRCSAVVSGLEGLYEERAHRRERGRKIFTRMEHVEQIARMDRGLPRLTTVKRTFAHVCAECITDSPSIGLAGLGWDNDKVQEAFDAEAEES
jgi:hypothetical protein